MNAKVGSIRRKYRFCAWIRLAVILLASAVLPAHSFLLVLHSEAAGESVLRELEMPEGSLVLREDLILHGLFSDGMVLQRGMPVPVWGWGPEGAVVTVEFAGQSKTAVVDSSNHWEILLDSMPASSTPQVLTVSSPVASIQFQVSDVLVGDVWICSGQSNMQTELKSYAKRDPVVNTDMLSASNQLVRIFKVDPASSQLLRRDVPTVRDNVYAPWANSFLNNQWRPCTVEWVPHISATAFYFAKNLQPVIDCPLGILISARGGTSIDKWVPAEIIKQASCWESVRGALDNAESRWEQMIAPYIEEWSLFRETYPDLNTLYLAQFVDPSIKIPKDVTWPSCFYKGMIHPLATFAATGVLWYQGEGDTGNAAPYTDKMIGLINAWRELWQRPDLPVIMAQIAGYDGYNGKGPDLRAAQARVPGLVSNAYMATLIDVGQRLKIHPIRKDIVGERLALIARKEIYQESVVAYGPVFESITKENGAMRVAFSHADGGLVAKEVDLDGIHLPAGTLEGFIICGADRVFYSAEAVIDSSNQVVVSCTQVSDPVAVRYAWADFPLANLYNGAGLPTTPFEAEEVILPTTSITLDEQYNGGANIAEYQGLDNVDYTDGISTSGTASFGAGKQVGSHDSNGLSRPAFYFELPASYAASDVARAVLRFKVNNINTGSTDLDIYSSSLTTLGTKDSIFAKAMYGDASFVDTGLSFSAADGTGIKEVSVVELVQAALAQTNSVIAFRFQMENDTALAPFSLDNYQIIGFGAAIEANRPELVLEVVDQ